MSATLGPYELRSELGRGAMAVVWRGYDRNLDREVAIKEPVLPEGIDSATKAELSARFVREGVAAARLSHPNIVTIFGADIYEGRPALVMELIEGRTLTELIRERSLTPDRVVDIVDQLLFAIGYAHGRGIIHRDIKPDNVFLTTDGRVKLGDFGVARIGGTTLTQAGTVIGTPGYMSPEQVVGKPVDARADIFGVGVLAYELATGRNPFGSDEAETTAVLYRIVHELPADPSTIEPSVSAGLAEVIARALAKDPDARYQTADEMRADLRARYASAPAPAAAATVISQPAATVLSDPAATAMSQPAATVLSDHAATAMSQPAATVTSAAQPGTAAQPYDATPSGPAPARKRAPLIIAAAIVAGLLVCGGIGAWWFRGYSAEQHAKSARDHLATIAAVYDRYASTSGTATSEGANTLLPMIEDVAKTGGAEVKAASSDVQALPDSELRTQLNSAVAAQLLIVTEYEAAAKLLRNEATIDAATTDAKKAMDGAEQVVSQGIDAWNAGDTATANQKTTAAATELKRVEGLILAAQKVDPEGASEYGPALDDVKKHVQWAELAAKATRAELDGKTAEAGTLSSQYNALDTELGALAEPKLFTETGWAWSRASAHLDKALTHTDTLNKAKARVEELLKQRAW